MFTTQEISHIKSKIYNLRMMKAAKSVANVKKDALVKFSLVDEVNHQWIADQWFGRCAAKSFQDVVNELSKVELS